MSSAAHLKTPELTQLLQEGGVDFRDCFERAELIARLEQSLPRLPPHVQQHLQHLLTQRRSSSSSSSSSSPSASPTPAPPLPSTSAAAMTPAAAQAAAEASGAVGAGVALGSALQLSGLSEEEQRVVQLYQRCRPSVVHIACSAVGQRASGVWAPHLNPEQVPRNFGSGFIWDKDGHVVTNYHVIHQASTAQVTLANNQKYTASLRGAEPDKDLAVLKIDAPSGVLVPVEVGVSNRLVVGQKVFAIGNPFGLDHTLTAGIVSGLGREMQSITGHRLRDVVQTDASINPGNSGGPLLDSRGRLIGVNTAATSHPQTTAGFGFAIPSDTVRRIVNQIVRYGRVVRPGLGVLCFHDLQSHQLVGPSGGVVVQGVVPRSGAEQAGLRGVTTDEYGNIRLGDVIVAVAGQRIDSVEDLTAYVEQFAVGDTVPLTLHRYTEESHLNRSFAVATAMVPLLQEAGRQ
ncbi:trypsin-like cysteine/serine peptidase domain-containing protein [Haematococcus lacustris]